MATATAILHVSRAIQRRLETNLSVMALPPGSIRIISIDLLPDPPPLPSVVIFLYNIHENSFLKNRQNQVFNAGPGISIVRPTPLVLDLDYMICAFTQETTEEHQLLGDIARVLYDVPEIEAQELNQAALPSPPTWGPEEAVQLSLANMTIEDQARIWSSFGFKRLKLSLYYKARTVPIRSERTFVEGIVGERRAPIEAIGGI